MKTRGHILTFSGDPNLDQDGRHERISRQDIDFAWIGQPAIVDARAMPP
jgi:hypothetical protein